MNYSNDAVPLKDTYRYTHKPMIENIKPATGRVVVLPDPAPEKIGSLIRPDSIKYVPDSGRVTHVGENVSYKVGDHVLFIKNAGVELQAEPVHFLMREEDIYATI